MYIRCILLCFGQLIRLCRRSAACIASWKADVECCSSQWETGGNFTKCASQWPSPLSNPLLSSSSSSSSNLPVGPTHSFLYRWRNPDNSQFGNGVSICQWLWTFSTAFPSRLARLPSVQTTCSGSSGCTVVCTLVRLAWETHMDTWGWKYEWWDLKRIQDMEPWSTRFN